MRFKDGDRIEVLPREGTARDLWGILGTVKRVSLPPRANPVFNFPLFVVVLDGPMRASSRDAIFTNDQLAPFSIVDRLAGLA